MFLRDESLHEFRAFLTGFCFGLDVLHPQEGFPHGSELREFGVWVRERLRAKHTTEWVDLLVSERGGDDHAAFEYFFVLWDAFVESGEPR